MKSIPLFHEDSGQFLNNCVFKQATTKAPMCPQDAFWSLNLAFEAVNIEWKSLISSVYIGDSDSKTWSMIIYEFHKSANNLKTINLPWSLQVFSASSMTGVQTDFGPSAFLAKSDATMGWNIRSFIIPVSFNMHSATH